MGLGTLTAIKGGAMTFGRMDETHHDHLNTTETSEKSKGVRLVSASLEISQIQKMNGLIKSKRKSNCCPYKCCYSTNREYN